MLKMTEEWKQIPDEPYEVSTLGNVRRVGSTKLVNPRMTRGYGRIYGAGGKLIRKEYYIHRLVAQAFIPNPDNLFLVDHIDRNRSNNIVTNLRWVSYCTNAHNKSRRSLNTSGIDHISWDKARDKWLVQLTHNHKRVLFKRYDDLEEAKAVLRAKLIELGRG